MGKGACMHDKSTAKEESDVRLVIITETYSRQKMSENSSGGN
jgi:hypothetical protein